MEWRSPELRKAQKSAQQGAWGSLGCMILCSDVRTRAGKNLAICFLDDPCSNLFRHKGSKMNGLAARFDSARAAKKEDLELSPQSSPRIADRLVVYFPCA